jgi:hypothetical protein
MSLLANFDRGKPFYPLVMNYFVQLFAIKELALHGLPGVETEVLVKTIADPLQSLLPNELEAVKADLNHDLQKLQGPLELRCEADNNRIIIGRDFFAHELVQNHLYILGFSLRAAGSLLILAHEFCKDKPFHSHDPLWEFLRHCRNAAGHNGAFTFRGGEPRRPAQWRGMNLHSGLHGMPLFKDSDDLGFLSPGDPVLLLSDIEHAFPGITL